VNLDFVESLKYFFHLLKLPPCT